MFGRDRMQRGGRGLIIHIKNANKCQFYEFARPKNRTHHISRAHRSLMYFFQYYDNKMNKMFDADFHLIVILID